MSSRNIESVCVFGSTARSASDQISDRDVMIVSGNNFRRKRLVARWTKAGWSVASYSPKRLRRMIEAGSLFVQHLKSEGLLVRDQGGWLKEKLSSAERKRSYEADAKASVSLVLPIERFDSEALIQHHPIVADLAYVALRNFGICHLADKDELVFDFYEIAEKIGRDFCLTAREMRLVRSLRAGKAAYRGGSRLAAIPGTVEELRIVFSKLFEHRPLQELRPGAPVRDLGNGYATLRDFEAAILQNLEKHRFTEFTDRHALLHICKIIKNPRVYAWDVRNSSQRALETFRRKLEALSHPILGSVCAHSRPKLPTSERLQEPCDGDTDTVMDSDRARLPRESGRMTV